MAVFIRCSSSFTRPLPVRSPPSDHISGKSNGPVIGSGNSPALLFNVRKFVPSVGDSLVGKPKIHYPLSGSISLHEKLKNHQQVKGNLDINQIRLPHVEGNQKLKLPTITFFFTSACILTTPVEALAETCESEGSFFNMPLLVLVALIGATVGGLLARQRRGELQRLNEQLRQINAALRRQAKIESYAPTLSYAPVGGRIADNEVIVDPRKQELISKLKTGKNFLRNQETEKAFVEFKTALELAQSLKDPIEEKKAARGLGASMQRQGKYKEAIQYHLMVLAISGRVGEESGNTEAYGAIADCYTELGDLEKAGKFYDKYIARLETD